MLPFLFFTLSSLTLLLLFSLSLLVFLLSLLSCGPLIARLKQRIMRSKEIEPDPHSHPCLPAIVPAHLHHDQHWDHLVIIIVVQLSPSFFYLVLSTLISLLSGYYSLFCSNFGGWGGRVSFKLRGGEGPCGRVKCVWGRLLVSWPFCVWEKYGCCIIMVVGKRASSQLMKHAVSWVFKIRKTVILYVYPIHINGPILD